MTQINELCSILFSKAHNPASWLRDAADESAQPKLDRESPFNFSPSDTLEKPMKRFFGQILEKHRNTLLLFEGAQRGGRERISSEIGQ
jgi:hypothetical protein